MASGVAVSSYFASVGVRVDNKTLKDVDQFLAKIDKKMQSGTGKKGFLVTPKIDVAAFEKHLRSVLRGFKNNTFRVKVQVSEEGVRKSLDAILVKRAFKVPVTISLSNSALAALRAQVQAALTGVNVNLKLGNVSQRTRSNSRKNPNDSWSPNPDNGRGLSTIEKLIGKTDKSSLNASSRRYYDSLAQEGLLKNINPNSLTGFAASAGIGSLGRLGSSTMLGRGIGLAGNAMFGARGGALGLVASAAIPAITGTVKGIWSSLGTMLTAPFRMVGGAIDTVTSSFYRLALVMAPVVAAFLGVNKKVQDVTSKDIGMNTIAERFGSTGDVEKRWLYRMAMTEGMRYDDMIMPFSSFVNAYAPRNGIAASRDMFQAFSQYGRVHGATKDSSGRAFYALSQMASKGSIMSEELNQQLAEAAGYSGMKSLVAQAYLMSTGKSKEEAKADKDAMQKLADAMKNSAAKTDKVFPFLVDLMREASSGGVAAAQKSSGAEEDRFWNRMEKGWENFTKGGGERGIAAFWQDMQFSIGAWWEENGASLGKSFEKAVQWFKVFRIGLTDFVKYLWTGETNSFVNWLAQEKGIDSSAIRVFFLDMYDLAKVTLTSIAQTVGLIDSEGKFNFKEFGDRVKNFLVSLKTAFTQIMEMFVYFGYGMERLAGILKGGWTSIVASTIPGTDSNKLLSDALANFGAGFNKFAGATATIGGSYIDAVTGEPTLKEPDRLKNKLSAMHIGSGSSGMSPRQHRLMYPELYDNSVAGFVATSPSLMGLGKDSRQQFDVNVNLKVEGAPDVLKSIDADYLVREISKGVLGDVNYNLMSSLPSASQF